MIVTFLVGLLTSRFNISGLLASVIVYAVLAGGALVGWHMFTGHYIAIGEARCDARWQAAVRKEDDRRRQEQEAVSREYERVIADLRAEEERLNDELIASAVEAANDPAANSCGLSAGGVRRVQSIR